MDKQLLQDEKQLGDLINQVKGFARSFRADDRLPAGSSLDFIPEASLPQVGAGAQDAMRIFEEQWKPYLKHALKSLPIAPAAAAKKKPSISITPQFIYHAIRNPSVTRRPGSRRNYP